LKNLEFLEYFHIVLI